MAAGPAGPRTLPGVRGWRRWLHRAVPLPEERARGRISSYAYGNILVLAAIAGIGGERIDDGSGIVLVLATTLTTYLAHIVAHSIGGRLGRDHADWRSHLREEMVDATPILSSGTLPTLLLLAGYLQWLPTAWSHALAGGLIVVRLALMGFQVERVSGQPASRGSFWSGVALALVSAVVVALKVTFAH
ncbi:hypothetical protein JL107_03310 [Nakamurella flavida]|uniref:Uncharacterized protein n=1 Tax=Nakamurella flavida TaxID=363630 RepID=A0A938YM67_9ACTN|nr:hypothetical protein [Nakamurella flavida]MBM9475465.1 hypothetical protein [Nakamurella flavida]MDP9777027.1 hypothetical protein [Nakamurella flavida]